MRDAYDVLVIGGGIAGSAAALAAAARGARTAVARAAPGATALVSGGWCGPLRPELDAALRSAGLPLQPVGTPLPHPSGTRVTCEYAPASHADPVPDPIVCGIAGLAGFHAPALARLWFGDDARHVTITIDDMPAAGWSPVSLAALLEREPERLGRPLAAVTSRRTAVLPAILGIDRVDDVRAGIGAPVVEALGVAPSIPGWRLQRALDRALEAAGVDRIAGRAHAARTGSERLTAVNITGDDSRSTIAARAFVLATGKFTGGGIQADERLREMALGMTATVERFGRTFEEADAVALTDADAGDVQPLLLAGVMDEDVPYANVFLAGTVRAGTDTARWALGEMAEDGWRAGESAARAAA